MAQREVQRQELLRVIEAGALLTSGGLGFKVQCLSCFGLAGLCHADNGIWDCRVVPSDLVEVVVVAAVVAAVTVAVAGVLEVVAVVVADYEPA